MKVKLAAETISKTNANLLKQLKEDGYEEFQQCESTVEYLLNFNDAFDIQNYAEKTQANDEYKQPICEASAEKIFTFAKRFKQYVERLEIEKVTTTTTKRIPVLNSIEGRGFMGFYNNFISLEGIYTDFVESGPLKIFYPFQFSQDHLESLFSLVRNSQGRNDNPSTIEFRAAFQKLLVCHPLITSKGTNVITNATGILTISSRKPTEIQLTSKSPPDQTQEYEIEVDYKTLFLDELNDMDQYDHHVIASVALSIEQKLIQKMNICKHKYKCSQCIEMLLTSSEKIHDNLLAMRVTNSQPSRSTVDIVTFANAVMKLISKQRGQGNDHNAVLRTIYNNLIIIKL